MLLEKQGERQTCIWLPFQHVPGQSACLCLGARTDIGIPGFRGTQQGCMPSSRSSFRAFWDVSLNWFKEFRLHVSRAHHHRPSLKHVSHHTKACRASKQLAESRPENARAGEQVVTIVTTSPHFLCNGTTCSVHH